MRRDNSTSADNDDIANPRKLNCKQSYTRSHSNDPLIEEKTVLQKESMARQTTAARSEPHGCLPAAQSTRT
jgi:hypothetical protein